MRSNQFVQHLRLGAQQEYVRSLQAQNNINAVAQACAERGYKTARGFYERCITAADLGIIDQNLDDKIGMEP